MPLETEEQWINVLFSMDYSNPKHREMMELEGLKKWLPGRKTGFGALSDAIERQNFFST
jgi:hypothetical protein